LSAYPELEKWNPKVEYFQHEPDLSLIAHIVTMQPYDDFETVTDVMNSINSFANKSRNTGRFLFGGRYFLPNNLCIFANLPRKC